MPDRKELLSEPVNVTLSLSDWLALAGWCSAHVTEPTPHLILACLRQVGSQAVNGGA